MQLKYSMFLIPYSNKLLISGSCVCHTDYPLIPLNYALFGGLELVKDEAATAVHSILDKIQNGKYNCQRGKALLKYMYSNKEC